MSDLPASAARFAGVLGLAAGWTPAPASRRPPDQGGDPSLSETVLTATVEVLARAIEARTQWSGGDPRRVQRHALALAMRAGLGDSQVNALRIAALLHDIGTLAVPPHILSKPGPLTADEFDQVRAHPEVGAALLGGIPFPDPVVPVILAHQERWDGGGYPRGLKGTAIPIGARILAIVDCYTSLRNPRPYRGAHSFGSACEILRLEAGRAFDRRLVEIYLAELPGIERAEPMSTDAALTLAGISQAERESALLFDLSQAMTATLGVRETLTTLLTRVKALVPLESGALFLAGDDGLLRCAAAYGLDPATLRILPVDDDQAAPVCALRAGKPVLNGDPIREASPADGGEVTAWRSSLVVPLVAAGRTIGALALYSSQDDAFGRAHARVMERAADFAGAAISKAMQFDQAQTDSLTDALTGLPNARFLMMHVTQELARATRLGSQVAMLVIDIDDFKRVNDSAGHHVGDRVLRELGRVLRASIRSYDVCARYGGDEFVVMLAECGSDEVADRQAQLESALSKVSVEAGERRMRVRASVGAAVFPHDGRTFEALLAAADRQMYRNKVRAKAHRRIGPAADAPTVRTHVPPDTAAIGRTK